MGRGAALLAGGLLVLQAAASTGLGRLVDRINGTSRAPVPTVGPRDVARPDMVWVPDRWIPALGALFGVLVSGYWERRISDREFFTPPLTGVNPVDGSLLVFPAGVRPPAEERRAP